MSKIWMPGGGGGGDGSDDCTLTLADVPQGLKAVTADSDDDAKDGTLDASASAADSHVLAGETYMKFSQETKHWEKRQGGLKNNGAVNATLNCGESKQIPGGFTTGGTVRANSLASQTPGTATAPQILAGQTAWVNGNRVDGTMPIRMSASYTPGRSNQVIGGNQFLAGDQTILGDWNLVPENILYGKHIFGETGICRPWAWRTGTATNGGRTYFRNVNGTTAYFYKFSFTMSGINPILVWIFAGPSCSVWCADFCSNQVFTFGRSGNIWISLTGDCIISPTEMSIPVQDYDITPTYCVAGY